MHSLAIGSDFVSLTMIRRWLHGNPKHLLEMLTQDLCIMPCQRGILHCHCGEKISLQCFARLSILAQVIVCQRIDFHMPYVRCCTRFTSKVYKDTLVLICASRYEIYASLMFDDCNIPFEKYFCKELVIFVTYISPFSAKYILLGMHNKVNLRDPPKGYHLGTWEGWRDSETQLYMGRFCEMRFITVDDFEIQERAIKRVKESEDSPHRCYLLPPPVVISNDLIRCYYEPLWCSCERRCSCPPRWKEVTLSKEAFARFIAEDSLKPKTLREYVRHNVTKIVKGFI